MIVMESPVRVRLREKNCIRLIGVKRFHRWYEMLKRGVLTLVIPRQFWLIILMVLFCFWLLMIGSTVVVT